MTEFVSTMQPHVPQSVFSIYIRPKQVAGLKTRELFPRKFLLDRLNNIVETNHFYKDLDKIFSIGPCIAWVLNIRTRQYEFVSNNIHHLLGYYPQEFIGRDSCFIKTFIHPQDLPRLCKLQQKVLRFLLRIPPQQHHHYTLNFNYRLQTANGRYVNLLEQSTVFRADYKGNITHLLIMATLTSSWKESDIPSANILSVGGESYDFCTPNEIKLDSKLTKRECQVIQLLAQGYSSKQIACKFNISVHTVTTHRKKMLEKTNSKNTSGLVQMAISKGWI